MANYFRVEDGTEILRSEYEKSETEQRLKALVVEDNEEMRATVCDILAENGYDVESACNGVDGLKVFERALPDIVVTDIMMPEKEGIETILELRRLCNDVKIVAMSGGGRTGNLSFLEMAKSLGADRVLSKPFLPSQLLNLVEDLVLSDPSMCEEAA